VRALARHTALHGCRCDLYSACFSSPPRTSQGPRPDQRTHCTRISCHSCHVAPLFLLFGDVPNPEVNQGRYYGSDAVRSPIDVYRGPGDPPYVGD
jgi:hypothetical protein